MIKEEIKDYFNGDDLAAEVFLNKYSLDSKETPDNMHLRLAKEFDRVEEKYQQKEHKIEVPFLQKTLSKYGIERANLSKDSIYKFFKDFKYIVPQGSIMYGLGRKDKYISLSNCFFVGRPMDSYSGIFQKDQESVQLYKRRGGVGLDISDLRPSGTIVSNSADTSTGAISFMERFSNSARETGQNGRRAALMITIDINHPDVEQFATIKEDLSKVTGANISIKLNREFMEAVENDKDYVLRFPCNKKLPSLPIEDIYPNELKTFNDRGERYYIKKIKAKELWNTIVKQARNNAEPGLLFWDNVLDYGPDSVYVEYRPMGTNPCVTGDTNILTENGYYPIQDLIDQKIKVWNGKEFSEVTPKITGVDQEILIIKLSDGRELKCTPYHKWYLWEGNSKGGKSVVKEAKNLIVGDKIEKYEFPVIDKGITHIDKIVYSQGFYSGDGNKDSNTIWLYDSKIDLADKLSGDFIGTEFTTSTGSKRRMFKLNFKNNPKEFVPVNEYSLKSKLDWLAGLLDADGVLTNDKGLQIVSIDYSFLINIQNLLSTLGCNSKIVSEREKCLRDLPDGKGGYKKYLCKETNRILIGAYQVKELIGLGLKTYRIDLSDVNPNRDASRFTTITSIEKQNGKEDIVYCFEEPKNHKGVFNGILTGQCGEITLQPYDSCRLMCLNLYSFVDNPFTDKAKINYKRLYEVAYEQQRLMDDLVDLETEAVDKIIKKIENDPEPLEVKQTELNLWKKIRETGINGRRTGSGITALADMLAAMGVKYDSQEALDIIDKVMRTKMEGELDCTIDLSVLRGSFKGWDKDKEFNTSGVEFLGKGKNDFYQMLINEFPYQVERMLTYGRRNISWSTVNGGFIK